MIFTSGYRITQLFGNNPDYYKQFGFAGHEGLDLVPNTKGGNDIYCVEGGEILRDIDDPKSGAYGIHVVVWNKEKQRAWWYCHMSVNYVELKKVVKAGEKIGVMGDTGNTQGAHLHLNLRYSDENANPINTNNGYKGFVDPLPVLKDLDTTMANTIPVDTKVYEKLVSNSTAKKEVAEYLKIVNPDDASSTEMKNVIGGIQSLVTTAQRERDEAVKDKSNAEAEVSRLRDSLAESTKAQDALVRQAKTQQEMLDKQGRDIGELNTTIQTLETENRELKKGSTQSLTLGDVAVLLFKKLFTVKL